MLTPRRRKIRPVMEKRIVKKRTPQPKMHFEQTEGGTAVIRINNSDAYVSFGKDDNIKWVSIHFSHGQSTMTKMYPVALMSIPKPATKSIGIKNIARIRELVRKNLKDGLLPRKCLLKMGVIINKENEE